MWKIVVVIVVALIAIILLFLYKRLSKARKNVNNNWDGVEFQIKRRFAIIPDIVECVSKYTIQEDNILKKLIRLSKQWDEIFDKQEKIETSSSLAKNLNELMQETQGYPDIIANATFGELIAELQDTEDKLQYGRKIYNESVEKYNKIINQFPTKIVAKIFKMKEEVPYVVRGEK